MPRHIARGNATGAQVRVRIEHVFTAEKHRMGLVMRTVGQLSSWNVARIRLSIRSEHPSTAVSGAGSP